MRIGAKDESNHLPFWHLCPPLGTGKIINIQLEIGAEIAAFLDTAFALMWTPLGRHLASILADSGVDFGPRARHAIFFKSSTALQREHDF